MYIMCIYIYIVAFPQKSDTLTAYVNLPGGQSNMNSDSRIPCVWKIPKHSDFP